MIGVIFEVKPFPERRNEYLDLAKNLAPFLEQHSGLISIERFVSLKDPDKLLSLSFWQNEAAAAQWRDAAPHRAAQTLGNLELFSDYRLRVASVLRDYGKFDRRQAPPRDDTHE